MKTKMILWNQKNLSGYHQGLDFLLASAGASAAIAIHTLFSQPKNNVFTYIHTLYTQIPTPIPFGIFTKLMLLVLIVLGASTIHYFKPSSSKGAFACGFVSLAILALFS